MASSPDSTPLPFGDTCQGSESPQEAWHRAAPATRPRLCRLHSGAGALNRAPLPLGLGGTTRGSASAEAGGSWCNAEGRAATSESQGGPEVTEQKPHPEAVLSTQAGALACPSKPPQASLGRLRLQDLARSPLCVPATGRTLKQGRPPTPSLLCRVSAGTPGPGPLRCSRSPRVPMPRRCQWGGGSQAPAQTEPLEVWGGPGGG